MEFNSVIENRYSCRTFAALAVEQEKVERILEAGRIVLTAVNKQPVYGWVVTNPSTLEAIKGVTRSNYGAPLLLVVGCRPGVGCSIYHPLVRQCLDEPAVRLEGTTGGWTVL